ncbi:MAG TPA: DEAD/DEAH box helicase family protein [Jiangellaceae bacterium]
MRPQQATAVADMVVLDLGVLVAPPGAGKTVMACAAIAHHDVPTLVVVDRNELVDQWRTRLETHLDIDPARIGQIGGGRDKPGGVIDIAMIQSLARRDDPALFDSYGLVVVDECHHGSGLGVIVVTGVLVASQQHRGEHGREHHGVLQHEQNV